MVVTRMLQLDGDIAIGWSSRQIRLPSRLEDTLLKKLIAFISIRVPVTLRRLICLISPISEIIPPSSSSPSFPVPPQKHTQTLSVQPRVVSYWRFRMHP